MQTPTHAPTEAPSGQVFQAMATTPAEVTMALQADRLGIDPEVAAAAITSLRSGRAAAVVVSGKLASGKDTIAALLDERLAATGTAPAAVVQTSDPMRAELGRIVGIVAENPTPEAAALAVADEMGLTVAAASHMAAQLFPVTRDRSSLPDPNQRTALNRHLLVFHADEGRRALDAEYWTRHFFQAVYAHLAEGRSAMLTGCRYPNEIGPAQTLGLVTVRLRVSRAVQEDRLWGRDGLEPRPEALDDPNECALDGYVGFNLEVGNDGDAAPTLDVIGEHVAAHMKRMRTVG